MADTPVEVPLEEIEISHDGFFSSVSKWNAEDSERASSAGVTRQSIGEFLKETAINSKALSHARQITKMKKESDKRDYIRSMKILLEFLENDLNGNGTKDMLDGAV